MASTTHDVFAKVRGHERSEQLRAAREADLLPYFRRLEGPAGPLVEMEGAEASCRIQQLLGLTETSAWSGRRRREAYGTGRPAHEAQRTIALPSSRAEIDDGWHRGGVVLHRPQANVRARHLLDDGDTVSPNRETRSILDGAS